MKADWRRDWPVAALLLAACVLIIPLWVVHSPGMPDYPAHVAGFALISGRVHSPYYSIHWMLVPNLASELIVPVLAKAMPLEVATRLFLSLAVLLWVWGPALVQRALTGRIGPTALASALFAYNANFTWGFFNYYFSAGLSFLVFAAWIATAKRRSPAVMTGFAFAVLALYVCHLFAVCMVLAMIGCFEISQVAVARTWQLRLLAKRALAVAMVFLPAAVMFLFFKAGGGQTGDIQFNYGDTIADRFGSAIQIYFSEPAYLELAALALLVLAGLMYHKLRFHPLAKILVLAFAVLGFMAPEWALGGWGVDLRLPAAFGALMFAAMELRLPPRWTQVSAALLVTAAAANAAILATSWRGYDRQYQEFRQAIRDLPRQSKLVTILDGDALDDESDPPYWHMAEFAIVDRDAFTPLMFATKGQHIVRVNPPFDKIAAATAQQGSPPDVTELVDLSLGRSDNDSDIAEVFPYLKYFQCHFTQAVVVFGDGDQQDVPSFMTLRHAGSFFSIYDIQPTRICKRI